MPAGRSRGEREAWEIRDGDSIIYGGLGVQGAVKNIHSTIAPALLGMDVRDQRNIDLAMIKLESKGLYTLSHVRYTPHESWIDDETTSEERIRTHDYLKNRPFKSNYRQMYNDVVRFIPALRDIKYRESIVEVKTVLVKSEDDDSRPILFRNDFGNDGYVCIMGGKLDNIYDAFEELRRIYGQEKAEQ